MPTGRPPPHRRQRGFTYLLLLAALVLAGAGLAAVGQAWHTGARREREAELLFRGLQLRDAIERYAAATPRGGSPWPANLEQLLQDDRASPPRHWLRRLYADPYTSRADWVLLRDPASGGITGVASRSRTPALRRHGLPAGVRVVTGAAGDPTPAVGDWHFIAVQRLAPPAAAFTSSSRSTP